MSFEYLPGIGMVHFQTVKQPRIVPGHERHQWSRKPARGQTTKCRKCGCVKCFRMNYETVFRMPGSTEILTERPACFSPTT